MCSRNAFGGCDTGFGEGVGLVYSNGTLAPTISTTIPQTLSMPGTTTGKATNLAGGSDGAIPYQSANNVTNFATGTGLVYSSGSGAPTISNTIPGAITLSGTTVAKSSNLVGGSNGAIPYQSATDTTGFASGTGLVYSSGSGAPTISSTIPQTLTMDGTTVGKATNLVGGSDGAIPYQSGPNTTAFKTGIGLVYSSGAGAPTISSTIPQTMVLAGTSVLKAENLIGGTNGAIPYQLGGDSTDFVSGTGLVYSSGSGAPTISSTIPQTLTMAGTTVGKATNLVGGTSGAIPYQSAADTTTYLPTTPGILTRFLNGGVPEFSNVISFTPTVIKSPFSGGGSLLSSFAYTVQEGFYQRINGFDAVMIRIQGTPTLTGGGIGLGLSCSINFNRNIFMDGLEFTNNSYPGVMLNARAAMGSNILNIYTSNLSLFTIASGSSYSFNFYAIGLDII